MRRLLNSFRWAIQGIVYGFKNEKNLKIITIVSIIVTATTIVLKIPRLETFVLIIISGLIISFELLNSAIEKLIDEIHPQYNKNLGIVKDYLAGAVLVLVIVSIILGLLIFPKPIFTITTNL